MVPIPSIGLAELIFLTGAIGLACCALALAVAVLAAMVLGRRSTPG